MIEYPVVASAPAHIRQQALAIEEGWDEIKFEGRAPRLSDLTAGGKVDYQQAYKEWETDPRVDNAMEKDIRGFRTWLLALVADIYKTTCCYGDATLDVWYDNLKNTAIAEIKSTEDEAQEGEEPIGRNRRQNRNKGNTTSTAQEGPKAVPMKRTMERQKSTGRGQGQQQPTKRGLCPREDEETDQQDT